MSVSIAIRVAGPDDALAVERVLDDSYPALMAGAYDAALLARALPRITRANPALLRAGTYYLAEAGSDPVGCGGWSVERPGTAVVEPGIGHVRHFATAAAWAGRGVGRAARCEAAARAAGLGVFECYASLNGEAFYAALGFDRIGPVTVPMGPGLGFPSIHMRRRIPERDPA
ncbi:MAG: GNAT family N-acetyltransferase [Methylobacterium frigidaeris]